MTTKQQIKNLSKTSQTNITHTILENLLLMGLGALAIVLHARLRTPLHLPGHHGIEFMAVLVVGRMMSRLPLASTISSFGIVLMLLVPILGFKDPLTATYYLIPGLMLDLCYNLFSTNKYKVALVSLFAGLSYMMIPVARYIFGLATGYFQPSLLKSGVVITILLFFMFGAGGGFLGAGGYSSIQKMIKRK